MGVLPSDHVINKMGGCCQRERKEKAALLQHSPTTSITTDGYSSTGEATVTDSRRQRPDPQNTGSEKAPKKAPIKKSYYFGSITRKEAENVLLRSQHFDGTFLVRDSEKQFPEGIPTYAISLLNNGIVFHIEIKTNDRGRYTIPELLSKSFSSVDKLVGHFQNTPLDLEGGCSVKLKYYLQNTNNVPS